MTDGVSRETRESDSRGKPRGIKGGPAAGPAGAEAWRRSMPGMMEEQSQCLL